MHKIFDLNLLGAHVAKTVTSEVRYGNPTPRISEVEKGIFIAIEENSYDKESELLKIKKFNFQKIDSFYVMDRLEVKNVQKNHSTLLTVNNILLNNNYEDSKFTQRSLKIIP